MPQTRTTQLWTSPVRATSGHVRRILIVALATLMVVAAAAIAPNARADAAPVNTNDPDYWETQTTHESWCFKHEVGAQTAHGAITDDGYTVTLNPFNPSWWGDHWELLVVKAGSGDGSNLVTDHPSAGVAYPAPDDKEVSHWIVCKGKNPPEPELGTIVVEKQTLPDGDGTHFTFTGDAEGVLIDGETITVTDLEPGKYTSTETARIGWDLIGISCDEGATGDLGTNTATFTIEGNETLKCTFTNQKTPEPELGTIVVEKQTLPDGDGTHFTFTGDAEGVLIDGETITVTDLEPGKYTSTETARIGWDLIGISCDEGATGDLGTNTATFTIEGNETLKCTFTNQKTPEPELGTIVVEKQTLPDGDGTHFTFTGDAEGVLIDGETITVTDLEPGKYTSTETARIGWDLIGISCDEGATGDLGTNTATFTIEGNETLKCTFTNQKTPEPEDASLTIVKNTINRNGTFAFESKALDDFEITTTSLTGSEVFGELKAGTYDVAEDLEALSARWSFVSVKCDAEEQELDQENATATVYLAAGDDVTCTFTNRYTRQPTDPDEPDIAIEKATNGQDADLPTGPVVDEGSTVTWTYVVKNTGDVTVTDIAVTDDNGTPTDSTDDFGVKCPRTTLAAGEAMDCTPVTGNAVLGQYGNVATVTGYALSVVPVTDRDPSHYKGVPASLVGGTAQLGDTVWLDVNKNGVQDSGEVGYNGADVILKDADANVVGTLTTTTGAWVGFYKFVGLDAGTYTAMLDLSTIGTYKVSTATAFTVTLAEGDDYLDADFGLYEEATPPTTTVPPEETLPTTGAETAGLAMLAAALLILGALAVLATRRRRIEDQ